MRILNILADNRGNRYLLFFVVLLILSALAQLLYTPIYGGDDFYFHMRRFKALSEAIADGSFPFFTDYTAAEGYGYLSNIFYPNILLIPFAALASLTGYIAAYQIMLFVTTVLCGVFTYHAVYKVYACHFIAFVASLLYTFSAYRLFEIYQRAALGEALSFTFLPIVLLGLYYILFTPDFKKKCYVIAIGFTLLIFSHILASILTFALVILITIFSYKNILQKPQRLGYLVFAGIATVLLTAAFTLPLLEQMTTGSFLYEVNRWAVPHSSKLSIQSLYRGLLPLSNSTQIPSVGIVLIIGIVLRLFIRSRWTNNRLLMYTDIGVIAGLCCIIASSSIFPWARFPFNQLSYIQFPWRLFEFASLFFAVASAFYLSLIFRESKQRFIARIFISIVCIGVIVAYSSNYRTNNCEGKDYIENSGIYDYDLGGGFEYIPAKFGSPFRVSERKDSVICRFNNSEVSDFSRNGRILSFSIITRGNDLVELPLFHYKGSAAKMDDKTLNITESKNGLVNVDIDRSGEVSVWYDGTPTQRIGWYISALTTLFLVLCLSSNYFIKRKHISH